jgi:light-regulated signal transduction histidine kinase (bacteriophytochrome)
MAESLQARQTEINELTRNLERRVFLRTAELEAANRELESFSSSVSHDLRAPLRHIDGFATMLESRASERLDKESLRYLETIKEAAKRMGKLIDNLLSFSRMAREPLSKTSVDLNDLMASVIQECTQGVNGRPIEWKVNFSSVVEADQAMLRQALVNLVSNALKYTRPRDKTVIEAGEVAGQPGTFFIRDNGVGFDMAYVKKLFSVFQRLHHEREFEGTGIGLANVQRIISRHGGRVWAEGKLGEGAIFYFTLPRGPA